MYEHRTPTSFAEALAWAGIDVVSIANNHALDAGETGLKTTRATLSEVGVHTVGAGRNLEEARHPFIVEREGIRFAFLAYSMFENSGPRGFALPHRAGVVPLDPFVIKQDIENVHDKVDYVVLSFHWGIENTQETHPVAREFARDIIDAGADVILGHHPHVPQGIEVYKGKVIFYSLGNFVFGCNYAEWGDNYLTRLTFTPNAIARVEVLPIAGREKDLGQPYPLQGDSARAVLQDIQVRTEALGTTMRIQGNIGVILPSSSNTEPISVWSKVTATLPHHVLWPALGIAAAIMAIVILAFVMVRRVIKS